MPNSTDLVSHATCFATRPSHIHSPAPVFRVVGIMAQEDGLRVGDAASSLSQVDSEADSVNPRLSARLAATKKECAGVAQVLASPDHALPAKDFGKQLDLTIVRVDEVAAMVETVRC